MPKSHSLRAVLSVAHVPSNCATCQRAGSLEVTQELRDDQLKWVERFACACGHAFEAAGVGQPAPVIRNAMLAQSGHAEVWLDEAAFRPTVVKLLTSVLGVKAPQATQQLATLPAIAFDGTHAEASFVEQALARLKVRVRVVNHLPRRP